jgi:hypothetical protein
MVLVVEVGSLPQDNLAPGGGSFFFVISNEDFFFAATFFGLAADVPDSFIRLL